MSLWEEGAFHLEDGALVVRVQFQRPVVSQRVHRVITVAGSERVPGLKRGEGTYRVTEPPGAELVDQAYLVLRRADGQEMKVHLRAGPFDANEGWFDAMSEWTVARRSEASGA